jgi:TPR repeat protein
MVRSLLCILLMCNAWSVAANELTRADHALMRGDYTAAVEILKTLSDDGNATAMTSLASLYHRGVGVQRDISKAVELYRVAAELGQSEAQFNLGNMYLLGEGLPQDESWALSFYRLAAEQGHELAAQNLRELYRASGVATTDAEPEAAAPQPDVAVESLAPSTSAIAVESGVASVDPEPAASPAAKAPGLTTTDLATTASVATSVTAPAPLAPGAGASEATGVPAVKLTPEMRQRRSADAGRSALQDEVSPAPIDAPIVALDPVEAPVETPAQPLTSDQSEALRLAKAYGIAVDIDSAEVDTPVAPARVAPAAGDPASEQTARYERAERMLALENYTPAITELTALAAARHAGSAWRLAALHASGQGVRRDEDAVLRWQERAAKLGHVDAQFELGEKYSGGRGVAPDEAMAITYYRDAARGGHVQAREKLRAIYDEAGLPMSELAPRRLPITATATATERTVPAPVASLNANMPSALANLRPNRVAGESPAALNETVMSAADTAKASAAAAVADETYALAATATPIAPSTASTASAAAEPITAAAATTAAAVVATEADAPAPVPVTEPGLAVLAEPANEPEPAAGPAPDRKPSAAATPVTQAVTAAVNPGIADGKRAPSTGTGSRPFRATAMRSTTSR